MGLHPLFASILAAHAPAPMADTYRGWTISFDFPPIPCRDFDWSATSPDYDCDCDDGGFFVSSGEVVYARTRDELMQAIDAAIADQSNPDAWRA